MYPIGYQLPQILPQWELFPPSLLGISTAALFMEDIITPHFHYHDNPLTGLPVTTYVSLPLPALPTSS